jgi:DNA-binding response OmpR family regulator
MDVMLPETDGVQPVLMLMAKAANTDQVNGLGSGADNDPTKPFDVEEFTARIFVMTMDGHG